MPYTPGPWLLESGRSIKTRGGDFFLSYGKDQYGNPRWKTHYAELDDNARLIAMAPELLETLKNIIIWDDGNLPGDLIDTAKQIIKKAEKG